MTDEEKMLEGAELDPAAELESGDALKICKEERDEYLNGWKRAMADFANYKKEEAARAESLVKRANERLMLDILPVLDALALGAAFAAKNAPDSAAAKGMEIVKAQLENALRAHGFEKLSAEKGAAFDPGVHEALMEKTSDAPEGTVAETVENGYAVNGRVLRPVRVAVAKAETSEGKQG